jgi:sporulation protein YlmC with PRC-barrel domain
MKTTKTLAKRAALIAVLVLGSSTWMSAQPKQGQIAPPAGGLDRQQTQYGTNSQYIQGQTGQPGSGLVRQQNRYGTNSQSSQLLSINKGSSLIGTTVKNQQGETLGKITDLVIDLNSERVSYLVLDSGAGISSTEKLHAIPLRAFKANSEGTALTLNADKAKLASSEGFTKDNWPTVGTATWGAEPFWKDTQEADEAAQKRALEQRYIQDQINQEPKDATKDFRGTKPQQAPFPRPW